MQRWHATFDEVEMAYRRAFPNASPPLAAQEVSAAEILHMGGDIPHDMQDPQLRRGAQLEALSDNAMPKAIDGNWGTVAHLQDINGGPAPLTANVNPNPTGVVIDLLGPPDKAEVLTVTLEQPIWTAAGSGGGLAHAKVVAVIQYGNGGSQNIAEIDWVQGTTFQVHASFLRVSGRIDMESGPVPASNAKCDVTAFATKLDCPRQSELLKGYQVGALAHTASATVVIASGVGGEIGGTNFGMVTKFRVMWANSGPAVTKVTVDVFDHSGNTLYTVDLTNDSDQWIPLFGRANEIRVTNADGANDISDSYLVFNVEL